MDEHLVAINEACYMPFPLLWEISWIVNGFQLLPVPSMDIVLVEIVIALLVAAAPEDQYLVLKANG